MNLHLITGGNGFVGNALADKLVTSGHKVRCLDLLRPKNPLPGVDYVCGDILNLDSVSAATKGTTYLYHAAAAVPLIRSTHAFTAVNIQGTKNIFAAAKAAGVRHYCQLSSSAVYGLIPSGHCPISESYAPNPFEHYGKSKLAADEFLLEAMRIPGAPSCSILRPRTVIGPGRLGVMQLLFEWIRIGCDLYLPGGGKNKFQLLDSRDLAAAAIASAMGQKSGIFNLGAAQFGTLEEDISFLCRHANSPSQVKNSGRVVSTLMEICGALRLSPLSHWHLEAVRSDCYFDLSKAKRELDWEPKYSNRQTLCDAYDWYCEASLQPTSSESIHRRPIPWGMLTLTKLAKYFRRRGSAA